jgi:hypothetical protein
VIRFALFPPPEYLKIVRIETSETRRALKAQKGRYGRFNFNSTREYSFAASPDAFPIFSFGKLVAIPVARGGTYLHLQKKH